MLRIKVYKIRRGYILCYTLIILSCISIIFLSLFKLVVLEYKSTNSLVNSAAKENILENDRVYLINTLSEKINSGILTIPLVDVKESIKRQIVNNYESMKFSRGRSDIYYDTNSNAFILKTAINSFDSRCEIYDYEVNNGLIMLTYLKTIYR